MQRSRLGAVSSSAPVQQLARPTAVGNRAVVSVPNSNAAIASKASTTMMAPGHCRGGQSGDLNLAIYQRPAGAPVCHERDVDLSADAVVPARLSRFFFAAESSAG